MLIVAAQEDRVGSRRRVIESWAVAVLKVIHVENKNDLVRKIGGPLAKQQGLSP